MSPVLARVVELARQLEYETDGFEDHSVKCPACNGNGYIDGTPLDDVVKVEDEGRAAVVDAKLAQDEVRFKCEVCTNGYATVEVDYEHAEFDDTRRELRLALVQLDLEEARTPKPNPFTISFALPLPLHKTTPPKQRRKRVAL